MSLQELIHQALFSSRPNVLVTLAPTSLSGSRLGAGVVNTSTPNAGICTCTAFPTGGTFAWRRLAGNSQQCNANSPSSASSSFSATVGIGDSFFDLFVCDYTFNGNLYTSSNSVAVTLSEQS